MATVPASPGNPTLYEEGYGAQPREGFALGFLLATIRRNIWPIAAIVGIALAIALHLGAAGGVHRMLNRHRHR